MKNEELIEEGIVIKSQNGIAEITIIEKGDCSECSAKVYCSPSEGNKKKLKVKDPFGVNPGDRVKVSLKGSNLFAASILLYGVPLVLLIIAILIGISFFEDSKNKELYGFLIGLGVLILYYFSVFIILRKKEEFIKLPQIIFVSSLSEN
ncbi:MAG TPA: SoxR reducing system RseC family protein [Melioribacteraceae bacterium]|nr:SoxR reducing system RseC family protein [Melioribacteraceae bacterium]